MALQTSQISNITRVLAIDASATSRTTTVLIVADLIGFAGGFCVIPRIYLHSGFAGAGGVSLGLVGLICEFLQVQRSTSIPRGRDINPNFF